MLFSAEFPCLHQCFLKGQLFYSLGLEIFSVRYHGLRSIITKKSHLLKNMTNCLLWWYTCNTNLVQNPLYDTFSKAFIQRGALCPIHQGQVSSYKRRFKHDMTFDLSTKQLTFVAVCLVFITGSETFQARCEGWLRGTKKMRRGGGGEGGQMERAWNVAVGIGKLVYLMYARQAGSVTQTESGLRSEDLTSKRGTHLSPAVGPSQVRPPGRKFKVRKENEMVTQIGLYGTKTEQYVKVCKVKKKRYSLK